MKVKHPIAALIIWFGLGAIALKIGMANFIFGVIFCLAAIWLYTAYYKRLH